MTLLVAPLFWATTPMIYGGNSMMPAAGPQSGEGMPGQARVQRQGQGQGQMQESINTKLVDYLTTNNTGEKYLFATTNAGTAEAYIIKTGKAVMAMGGFSGSDPILTVDKLKQMIANKEIKYVLLSSGGPGGGSSDVQTWIRSNGTAIPSSEWQSSTDSSGGMGMDRNGSSALYEIKS